jgi:hypothetical protein
MFAADSTFNVSGKRWGAGFFETDCDFKTLYILGETGGNKPVLYRTSGTGGVFEFNGDTPAPEDSIVIRNLEINAANAGGKIFSINNYLQITLTDLEGDMASANIVATGDAITVEDCNLESTNNPLHILVWSGRSFDHEVKDCALTNSSTSGQQACIQSTNYDESSGTLELYGNTFSSSGSTYKDYLELQAESSTTDTINLRLIGNDFNNTTLFIQDLYSESANVVLNTYYSDNESEVDVCVENTYRNHSVPPYHTPTWDIRDYTYLSDDYGYESFTEIDTMYACVIDDTAYVMFESDAKDNGLDNYTFESATVTYGDASCTTTMNAWKNDYDQWVEKFDVSSFGRDFYWQTEVSFCSKSVESSCISTSTKPCGSIPLWFKEEPGGESAGGKEDEEDPEEENGNGE